MSSSAPAPLAPRSDQELFDAALFGIRNQGCFSLHEFGRCVYRGAGGAKCAVGHLIPDNVIEEVGAFETAAMADITNGGPLTPVEERLVAALDMSGVSEKQYGLLERLQDAHDSSSRLTINPFDGFERQMRGVAACFGLTYTPPSP